MKQKGKNHHKMLTQLGLKALIQKKQSYIQILILQTLYKILADTNTKKPKPQISVKPLKCHYYHNQCVS